MKNLDQWLKHVFTNLGVPATLVTYLNDLIIVIGLILLGLTVNYLLKGFLLGGIRKLTKRTYYRWDDILYNRKVITYLLSMVPGILIYMTLPLIFDSDRTIFNYIRKFTVIVIFFYFIMAINGLILSAYDYILLKSENKHRPIKGFIQVIQVVLFFIGIIIIIGIIINRSPAALFAGLGASAAILSLVFKDTLVGFIAGVQLSMNDMVRPGDWISLSDGKTEGIVQEITLITVKIKNFDNSISTVPPTVLVANTFRNWREIDSSEGRPVHKILYVDKTTVQFLTPEMITRFGTDVPDFGRFVPDPGKAETNSQLFRVYMENFLDAHPDIDNQLGVRISQQEITDRGIPLEFYFFSLASDDKAYSDQQSNIFDYAVAVLPRFGLKVT